MSVSAKSVSKLQTFSWEKVHVITKHVWMYRFDAGKRVPVNRETRYKVPDTEVSDGLVDTFSFYMSSTSLTFISSW